MTFNAALFLSQILDGNLCAKNYLELRDGPYETSTLIKKYCEDDMPPHFMTTGKDLFTRFVTESVIDSRAYSAQLVRGQQNHCGRIATRLTSKCFQPTAVTTT